MNPSGVARPPETQLTATKPRVLCDQLPTLVLESNTPRYWQALDPSTPWLKRAPASFAALTSRIFVSFSTVWLPPLVEADTCATLIASSLNCDATGAVFLKVVPVGSTTPVSVFCPAVAVHDAVTVNDAPGFTFVCVPCASGWLTPDRLIAHGTLPTAAVPVFFTTNVTVTWSPDLRLLAGAVVSVCPSTLM